MSVREATLEQTIDMSRRLSLPERLRLLSILSGEVSDQIAASSPSTPVLDEDDEAFLLTRGIYEVGMDKAWSQVIGFLRTPNGLYERFEETAFNSVFAMARVKELLLQTGWKHVYCARIDNLTRPIEQPEPEPRVFFVARKILST